MKTNVTYSVGNLAVIDKVDDELGGYFQCVFGGIGGKARDFVPGVKLFMYNRMGDCMATNRLTSYPAELFTALEFENIPGDRSFYRMIERVGKNHVFVLEQHQKILKGYNLVTEEQFFDFSSSYFEGKAEALGERGYSRDNQPGKKQITFGISTGINSIPTALTIQKGNVQDKTHFRLMLKTADAILEPGSLLIFDCGGNTKGNKKRVRRKKLHYLTLKAKKVKPYRKAICEFHSGQKVVFELNNRTYECMKVRQNDEIHYIFYSEELKREQVTIKNSKFIKELKKNQPLLYRTKAGKPLGQYPTEEGIVIAKGALQKTVEEELINPHINGIEGFFILESSVDEDPKQILWLYKNKDKAEKLIRNIKEGTELRPMRHWSKWAIIGHVVLVFLTNFLINLTLLKAKKPVVKNVKLLKKYLMKLTVTVVYPPNGFRFHILANISPEILSILGNFIDKYRDKTLPLRW